MGGIDGYPKPFAPGMCPVPAARGAGMIAGPVVLCMSRFQAETVRVRRQPGLGRGFGGRGMAADADLVAVRVVKIGSVIIGVVVRS